MRRSSFRPGARPSHRNELRSRPPNTHGFQCLSGQPRRPREVMGPLRLLPEITPIGCGQLPRPLVSPRCSVDIPKRWTRPQPCSGLTHQSSCRRRLKSPRTQIRLGTLAGFLSLMAGSGGGNRDLSASGRVSPLKSATQSSGRLPQVCGVFACEAIRLGTGCDQQ